MAHPVFANPAQSKPDDRAGFITKTYMHLAGAILVFMGLEALLLNSAEGKKLGQALMGHWMWVLGAYVVVSWLCSSFVHGVQSKFGQYVCLGIYIAAETVIFLPLLMIAQSVAAESGLAANSLIFRAAMITLSGFLALTAIAFVTRKNFSFLRGFLMWGGVLALILIGCSFLFGLNLGIWFSVAMVGFAGAAILYDTSNVIHEYGEDQYVGASLQLFASFALMLWYVLRIVISLASSD
ncbi:MAG: Bax inhibitor-1 family protein [Lentisphaerales bacterium]|nr:Bax inhibitor-1 family protein [Lentisphaerales bacterium]